MVLKVRFTIIVFRDADGQISLTRVPPVGNRLKNIFLKTFLWLSTRFYNSFRDYPFSIYEHDIACKSLLLDFVDAIRREKPFPIGFHEGHLAVELCLACIQSYQNKQIVILD